LGPGLWVKERTISDQNVPSYQCPRFELRSFSSTIFQDWIGHYSKTLSKFLPKLVAMISKYLVVVVSVLFWTTGSFSLDIYVSLTGSDSNTGLSLGSPFLTIQRAIDKYREVKNSNSETTIQIASGNYSLTNAILLTSSDNPSGKLTFKGVGTTRPILKGSISLTGTWKPLGVKNIWYLESIDQIIQTQTGNVPVLPFMNLYVNDQRAFRARNPNNGE
jgi:hypothetical protein